MTKKMTVYEMARHYYPRLWSIERIETLYKSDKLTKEEYEKIINSKQE